MATPSGKRLRRDGGGARTACPEGRRHLLPIVSVPPRRGRAPPARRPKGFSSSPSMQVIRGRKALVTGAASGIGRALALALAREGADLFLIDRDEAALADVTRAAEGLGVRVTATLCDLTQPAEIAAAVAAVLSGGGALHILVNNAG